MKIHQSPGNLCLSALRLSPGSSVRGSARITIFLGIFWGAFLLAGRQHDVLFEAAAVHGERTELIYLRSGPAAPFSGISR